MSKQRPLRIVTIRLVEQDIAMAKRIASKVGTYYQTLVRDLLHGALIAKHAELNAARRPTIR